MFTYFSDVSLRHTSRLRAMPKRMILLQREISCGDIHHEYTLTEASGYRCNDGEPAIALWSQRPRN